MSGAGLVLEGSLLNPHPCPPKVDLPKNNSSQLSQICQNNLPGPTFGRENSSLIHDGFLFSMAADTKPQQKPEGWL